MPYVHWESKKITPEELRQQTLNLFDVISKRVKPFKLESLEDKWTRVQEVALAQTYKRENYVKQVESEEHEEDVLREEPVPYMIGTKLKDDVSLRDLMKRSY